MKFILFSFSLLFNGPIFANIYFPFENLAQVKDVETQLIDAAASFLAQTYGKDPISSMSFINQKINIFCKKSELENCKDFTSLAIVYLKSSKHIAQGARFKTVKEEIRKFNVERLFFISQCKGDLNCLNLSLTKFCKIQNETSRFNYSFCVSSYFFESTMLKKYNLK